MVTDSVFSEALSALSVLRALPHKTSNEPVLSRPVRSILNHVFAVQGPATRFLAWSGSPGQILLVCHSEVRVYAGTQVTDIEKR